MKLGATVGSGMATTIQRKTLVLHVCTGQLHRANSISLLDKRGGEEGITRQDYHKSPRTLPCSLYHNT